MKPEDMKLTDFRRLFLGEVPWSFLLELCFRSLILYIVLLVSMRIMGKKLATQYSRNEMAAMVSLAAAIGIPLESADRGILPVLIVVILVVSIQQWLASRSQANILFENRVSDTYDIVIRDQVLDLQALKKTKITKSRLFAELRTKGLTHLGEVKLLILESNGSFTLLKNEPSTSGLSIIPLRDQEFEKSIPITSLKNACNHCGTIAPRGRTQERCSHCQALEWVRAIG